MIRTGAHKQALNSKKVRILTVKVSEELLTLEKMSVSKSFSERPLQPFSEARGKRIYHRPGNFPIPGGPKVRKLTSGIL